MARIYQFTTPPSNVDFLLDFAVVDQEGKVMFRSNSVSAALEFAAAVDGDPDVKQSCLFFFPHKAAQSGWISIFAMDKEGCP